MPHVTVKLVGKLTRKQKEDIAKGITDILEKMAGKDSKYTHVVFEEVERENWAVAGKLLG